MALETLSVRDQQRRTWDSVCPGWQRWHDQFERGAGPVTTRLLKLGGVAGGQTVLDVGSGVGEPALTAARVARRVVGVDVSPAMIVAARAAASGLENVEFVLGDAERVPLPADAFDVVLSRWGLMFAVQRGALLARLVEVLRPGGRLAAAVWGQPQDVPMISLAFRVIARELELEPPPPGPGPFTMCDPATVREELADAGFTDVRIQAGVAPFWFGSIADFARFARDVLPGGMKRLIAEHRGSVMDPALWRAFAAEARAYERADGTVSLPSRCLYLRGTAP
jgi:SAM-dependent methyltransferase